MVEPLVGGNEFDCSAYSATEASLEVGETGDWAYEQSSQTLHAVEASPTHSPGSRAQACRDLIVDFDAGSDVDVDVGIVVVAAAALVVASAIVGRRDSFAGWNCHPC